MKIAVLIALAVCLASNIVAKAADAVPDGGGLPKPSELLVDRAIRIVDGDWIVYRYHPHSDDGFTVFRTDPTMAKVRWQTHCNGLGMPHSKWTQKIDADIINGQVVMSWVGYEGVSETLDLATGKSIDRKPLK